MNGIIGKGAEDHARSLIDRVGLAHRINDRSAVLSRGMRQRLAIARALSHSPKILLLDEPFSSLDQRGVEILTEMLENEREKGRSIIVITHEFSRITSLMDRADILIRGKIHRSFSSKELSNIDLRSSYREIVLEAGGQ
jgi:ABC-type multidrug transport system ATPase subunit